MDDSITSVGYVKNIRVDKGYGFIAVPRRGDAFFHCKNLGPDLQFDERLQGRRVAFELVIDEKSGRERAVNLRPSS